MGPSTTLAVSEIPTEHLRYFEDVLGCALQPSQHVRLVTYSPEATPDEATQLAAIERLEELSRQAAEYQRAHGITEAEIDGAIDEAIAHVRKSRRQS
jgi:hypothetical protein